MSPKVAFGPLRSHLIHPWTVALPVTFHVSFAWRGNDHTSRAGSKLVMIVATYEALYIPAAVAAEPWTSSVRTSLMTAKSEARNQVYPLREASRSMPAAIEAAEASLPAAIGVGATMRLRCSVHR